MGKSSNKLISSIPCLSTRGQFSKEMECLRVTADGSGRHLDATDSTELFKPLGRLSDSEKKNNPKL